ncbi:MAG: aldo/keto reductase [Candidatus Melainabacteria bacterium]|nr:aldo/keto reductase [Candidatus Melainabacteria bacterium]
MEYRILGRTNLKVSAIGFGAWAIGGDMWGPQNDKTSTAAINKAIDLGLNFIDTAAGYGDGHSEKIIGKVLKTRKERIYTATKIPPLMWPPPPSTRAKDAFPKDSIVQYVEQSLKNLQVDCIDLIQLHSWRKNWTDDTEWYETLTKLKKAGKINFIGVSVHDGLEDEALGLIETGRVDTIQVVYNILAQTPQKNLFPKALKHNIGIIARVPLAYGALSGKFTSNTTFPSGDFRSGKYAGNGLKYILSEIERYKKIVRTDDKEKLVSAALHFALAHKAVSLTIPGIRNAKQAEENCSIFENEKAISKEIINKLTEFTIQKIH